MATIPTPASPDCSCSVTAEHRILDRDCPRHGTAADEARRHPSWCDPSECSTRDDQLVHRSAGEAFDLDTSRIWTASMLTVQLVEANEGVKVGLAVEGALMRSSEILVPPEVAAELGDALLDHARRAGAWPDSAADACIVTGSSASPAYLRDLLRRGGGGWVSGGLLGDRRRTGAQW